MESLASASCKTQCSTSEENLTPVNGVLPTDESGPQPLDTAHRENNGGEEGNNDESTTTMISGCNGPVDVGNDANLVSNGLVHQAPVGTENDNEESTENDNEESTEIDNEESMEVTKNEESTENDNEESMEVTENTSTTFDDGGSHQETTAPVGMSGEDTEDESLASTETNGSNFPSTSRALEPHIIPTTVDLEKLNIRPENIPTFSPSTSAASTADEESACSSAEASSGTSTPSSKAFTQSSILYSILTSKLQSEGITAGSNPVPHVVVDEGMKKTYKCRHCSRLFLKEYDFKQHERCHIIANEKPHQCPQCGKRYNQNSKLNVHMRIHTGEQPYKCEKCNKRFMARSNLIKHEQRCEVMESFRRRYVTNLLEDKSSKTSEKKPLKAVKKPKTNVKSAAMSSKVKLTGGSDSQKVVYRCENCYYICPNKESFVKHTKQHKAEVAAEGLFTCKKCGKCYELEKNLKIHMKLHDGSAPFVCKICGFQCLRNYNLQIHMTWHRTNKANQKLVNAYNKRYKCTVCKKPFPRISELLFHMRGHPNSKSKGTASVKELKVKSKLDASKEGGQVGEWPNVHDKMSYGSKFNANCPHCRKNFTRKFDLLRHIKTHVNRNTFVCKFCDWTFMAKANYLKHLDLHTSRDTHSCRSCGLVYKKKVEIHRQEKLCWFKTRQALLGLKGNEKSEESSAHYWEVMKPDPITCKYCDLTFSSLSNMYTHKRRHDEKGHACRWCGMIYEKKKQEHDRKFNCWLKTRQGIMKKENEKFKKVGSKPLDLLQEEDTADEGPRGNKQQQKQHQQQEEKKKKKSDLWRYECQYCNWVFVDASNKAQHQVLHEGGNHSCRWCGLVYKAKRQKHDRNSRCWLTTKEGRLQKSGMAKKNLAVLPKIQTPDEISTEDKEFKCDKCEKSFDKPQFLLLHMLIHSEVRPYTCSKCNRSFKQQANLTKHQMYHNYQCRQCLKRFEKESDYQKHVTNAPHQFKCQNCERSYINKVSLKNHLHKVHKDQQVSKSGAKKFACKVCNMKFAQSHSLTLHTRFVHRGTPAPSQKESSVSKGDSGGPPYKCSRCDRTFPLKCNLTRHSQSHIAAPHKCHHCGLMFKTRVNHQNHLIKKHKEKPLKCSECDRGFVLKSVFDAHMQTHKAQQNNECHVCGKAFVKRKNYLNHLQIHSKTTPYACKECGTGFILENQYKVHLKVHHKKDARNEFSYSDQSSVDDGSTSEGVPELPSSSQVKKAKGAGGFDLSKVHGCATCGKRFKMKCHLALHQRSRQECGRQSVGWTKRHNKCRYCNMSFANSARLIIHVKNVHQKQATQYANNNQPPEKQSSSNSKAVQSKPEFKCPKCSRIFHTSWSFQRHLRFYHKGGKKQIFHCQYCQETSKRIDFHVAHEKLHTNNVYKIQCQVCHVGFKCNEDLETHMVTHGKVASGNQEGSAEQTEKTYTCRYCNIGFTRLTFLKRHERFHAQESRPYTCKHCGMKFRRFAGLTKHGSLKHPGEEQIEPEGAKPKSGPVVRAEDYKKTSPNFTCRGCNKEFIRQNTFEVHEKSCLEKHGKTQTEMESDVTGSASPTADLVDSMEVGTSSESVSSESDAVDMSQEASSGRKFRYQCKSCSRYISGGKQQYEQCRVCRMNKGVESESRSEEPDTGEETVAAEDMMESQQQDSKEFVCKFCGRFFAYEEGPGGLTNHMKQCCSKKNGPKDTDYPEKSNDGKETGSLDCDVCGQSFTYAGSLNTHKRFHTGQYPYLCLVCSKSFPRKDYLQRHKKTEHPSCSDDTNNDSETIGTSDQVRDTEDNLT